jgi:glutathione S-transferase
VRVFLGKHDDPRLPELLRRGHAALEVMEKHLARRDYFAGNSLSLADLALFAYTHKAGDGGFDLGPYPAVRNWLARVATTPGVSTMPTP